MITGFIFTFYQIISIISPFFVFEFCMVPAGSSMTVEKTGFHKKILFGKSRSLSITARFLLSSIRISIGYFIKKVWIPYLVLKIIVLPSGDVIRPRIFSTRLCAGCAWELKVVFLDEFIIFMIYTIIYDRTNS